MITWRLLWPSTIQLISSAKHRWSNTSHRQNTNNQEMVWKFWKHPKQTLSYQCQCHQQTIPLMSYQPWRKQRKQSSKCQMARLQASMLFLPCLQLRWIKATSKADRSIHLRVVKRPCSTRFRDANIVHLYKIKGSWHDCNNHREISLLSKGKILARIMLNRLIKYLEKGLLSEIQCGYHAGRGTIDMIFAARQIQEKCQEQNQDIYVTFVNLTKAFDTVSRDGLHQIMEKFSCPQKFLSTTTAWWLMCKVKVKHPTYLH